MKAAWLLPGEENTRFALESTEPSARDLSNSLVKSAVAVNTPCLLSSGTSNHTLPRDDTNAHSHGPLLSRFHVSYENKKDGVKLWK